MAKNIIKRLEPSDIISESMHKINYNFDLLQNRDDVDEYKYLNEFKRINDRLDEIQRNSDARDVDLANGLISLNDKMEGTSSTLDIQDAINSAIASANQSLRSFIVSTVGQQVEAAIGDYATTSSVSMNDVNAAIEAALAGLPSGGDIDWDSINWEEILSDIELGYVRSAAFEAFEADSSRRHAEASTIVANNVFVQTSDGYLIYADTGDKSLYQNTFGGFWNFYQDLSQEEKDEIISKLDLGEDEEAPTTMEEAVQNSKFVNALIAKMELTFRTIAKEMSMIMQKVDDGAAEIDIIATVKQSLNADETGDDAQDITAAIFVTANQSGSEIVLNADRLNLDANHKLTLNTGTFEINSDNFIVTPDGDVTAHDMVAHNLTVYGITANNISLSSNGGKTLIDQFGILHAQGAEIEGKIKADEFEATAEREIETDDGYTGTVTRSTKINADSFKIQTIGSLTNGTKNIDLSQNALYIEIVDKMANPNYGDSTKPLNDVEYLYGVPTLCMLYEGEPYRMSPGSWISANQNPAITSNIRWDTRYDTLDYTFIVPASTNATLSSYYYTNKDVAQLTPQNCTRPTLNTLIGINGDYYIFKPNQQSKFLNIGNSDMMSQVHVYDMGSDPSASYNIIKSKNLTGYSKTGSNIDVETLNKKAAYTYRSNVPDIYRDYEPETRTTISDYICGNYQGYLRDTITTSKPYTYQQAWSTTLPTDFGVSKMYDFIKFAAGAEVGRGGSGWAGNNETDWYVDGYRAEIEGLQKNLMPFDTGGYYQNYGKTCTLTLKYYPMFDISNNGLTVSNKISKLWVECELKIVSSGYNGGQAYNSTYTPFFRKHTDPVIGGNFNPIAMGFSINFNIFMDMGSNGITFSGNTPFDPLDDSHKQVILNKINSFLTNFNFCERHLTERMIQFDASIIGVGVNNIQGQYVFTKSTFNPNYDINS